MSLVETKEIYLPKPEYDYIVSEEKARTALSEISKFDRIAIDTEATDLDPFYAKVSLLQIGTPTKVYVFDVRSDTDFSNVDLSLFEPLLVNPHIQKLLQNAVFDMKLIKANHGFYINNIVDLMLIEQLLGLGKVFAGASLAKLVKKYLGITMPKEPAHTFKDYYQKFKPFQLEYAANDVVVLSTIKELQWGQIVKEGLTDAARLEFEFTKPMCEMELNGIKIDVDKWHLIMENIAEQREKLHFDISKMLSKGSDQGFLFGVPSVNIDSPIQLKEALSHHGLSNIDSTDEATLTKFQGIPVIDTLLKYRKANKLISTYGEALLNQIHSVTNRLHTDFKQMVSTGRMSSARPNLQNIPKKQLYRSCFIAEEGNSLITADMSGAELRILGNLSADPVFIECYATGIDLHTRTASEVFNVSMDKVTKDMRNAAKAINFGLCTTADTQLITNGGIKKIIHSNLNDVVAHDFGSNQIIDKQYMGEKEVFEIQTKYGYSIELTSDHIVKVINANGEYVDVPLNKIDIKQDLICIKKGSFLFPEMLPKFGDFKVVEGTNYKPMPLPDEMNKDVAAFLGLFVAEGSILKAKGREHYSTVSFGFSNENKEFISKIDKLLFRLFKDRISKTEGTYTRYTINSVLFAEWLVNVCDINNKNKTFDVGVPGCIKRAPLGYQTEFLKWLFEGDGSVKLNGAGYKITYSSASYNLVKDVQLMLLNLGIVSSIIEESREGYNNTYYVLSVISQNSSELFIKYIGFVTDLKNCKCKSEVHYNVSSYFIGKYKDRIDHTVHNYEISKQLKDRFYKSRFSDSVGDIYLKELSKYDSLFKMLYEKGIVPLEIRSIKSKGLKKVYDISVEEHPYFLANGFVVHNCYGLSKYGLARRLKISEAKADQMITTYFKRYRGVKKYLEKAAKDAVMNRFSRSISGRKRYYTLPEYGNPDFGRLKSSVERRAKNAPIQGCLSFDTIIKGQGKIGSLKNVQCSLETGIGSDNAIGVYSGEKEVFTLTLSNGATLDITSDHKIPICKQYGDNYNIEDVKVADLEEDDLLIIPLNIVSGRTTNLSGFKYEKGHRRETYVNYNLPSKMNADLAFIIGCLIGNGSYTKHNHFAFVCPQNQKELFEKFNNAVYDQFGYKSKIRMRHKNDANRDPLPWSQVNSVVIRGFLKHIGLDYVSHHKKAIPDYFHTETIENKGALLNGLFSTGGEMTKESGPSFTTTSEQLAKSVHQLLFSLGINSNLKIYDRVYKIQIPKRFNSRFKKYVGFSTKIKDKILDEESSIPMFGDGGVVPEFIPKLIEKTFRENKDRYASLSFPEKAHLRRFKLGKSSYVSWRKFYYKLPNGPNKQLLSRFLNFDFCKKKHISYKGKEKTYDLMCNNIHYFTANGVLVHNSNADTIKQSMIYLVDRLEKSSYDAKLILTVHDEVVVECKHEERHDVGKLVANSLIDGFGHYFHKIPMETDALIGPCWLKSECDCGNDEMIFVPDKKYKTKLICNKCKKEI